MAINMSVALRTARANQIEVAVGANAILHIFTGAVPATCAAGNSSSNICAMPLGANWLADAANGAVTKNGTWQGNATANGTAGNWRIFASDATTCHMQGNCANANGDMTLDNVSIAINQTVTVNAFTLTEGNT
jgi:hypothetical protein